MTTTSIQCRVVAGTSLCPCLKDTTRCTVCTPNPEYAELASCNYDELSEAYEEAYNSADHGFLAAIRKELAIRG